ncbi:MAG TPA: CoA transferase, partial [Thermoanaerobaculia bacterium]|nr:CoA transferase [Thermoanaerobaculia bacterium]
EELIALLERIFAGAPAAQWVERCRKASIPASLVRGVREALRTTEGNVLIETIEHPEIGRYEAVRNPIRIDGERCPPSSPPPGLGEHTEAVLRWLAERDDRQHGAAK